MTNSKLLKQYIKESGLRIGYIADKLGISRTCLYNKMNGKTFFNQYEINELCSILGIKQLSVQKSLFFCSNVDK